MSAARDGSQCVGLPPKLNVQHHDEAQTCMLLSCRRSLFRPYRNRLRCICPGTVGGDLRKAQNSRSRCAASGPPPLQGTPACSLASVQLTHRRQTSRWSPKKTSIRVYSNGSTNSHRRPVSVPRQNLQPSSPLPRPVTSFIYWLLMPRVCSLYCYFASALLNAGQS